MIGGLAGKASVRTLGELIALVKLWTMPRHAGTRHSPQQMLAPGVPPRRTISQI
jgi:hypothetical protein